MRRPFDCLNLTHFGEHGIMVAQYKSEAAMEFEIVVNDYDGYDVVEEESDTHCTRMN